MKLYPHVSHVDRMNTAAPPFSWPLEAINAPYDADERGVFVTGAAKAEVFVAGAAAAQVDTE